MDWLTTAANWSGENGVWHRLKQHLVLTFSCLVISALIALPVALTLGHLGRGGALAVNLANIGRAVPTFAVLSCFCSPPLDGMASGRRSSRWCCSPSRRC